MTAVTPWAPHVSCACPLPDAHDCSRSRCSERAFDDGLGEIECDECGCECECRCHVDLEDDEPADQDGGGWTDDPTDAEGWF